MKILNASFNSADVKKYKMAQKGLEELSAAGWGVERIFRKAKELGLYK